MRMRQLGQLWPVSTLSLGGGGIGQLWGQTSRREAVETLRAAAGAGISLLDMAPAYGDGEAERVVGAAFRGRLPSHVKVTTKCRIGRDVPIRLIGDVLRRSVEQSLANLRVPSIDVFFLHSSIAPDLHPMLQSPEAPVRVVAWTVYETGVLPALERLVERGLISAWGITGVGYPDCILDALAASPSPKAVQCITNVLDSPGSLKFYQEPARPRQIIAKAASLGVGVLGIRAVQAGALADAIDRPLPEDHPETLDYRRSVSFRKVARQIGESSASLAHRYALSMAGVDTVVLGVKNRTELNECLRAEAAGPLSPDLIALIDRSVTSRRIASAPEET